MIKGENAKLSRRTSPDDLSALQARFARSRPGAAYARPIGISVLAPLSHSVTWTSAAAWTPPTGPATSIAAASPSVALLDTVFMTFLFQDGSRSASHPDRDPARIATPSLRQIKLTSERSIGGADTTVSQLSA
jgi:hypothetical protein